MSTQRGIGTEYTVPGTVVNIRYILLLTLITGAWCPQLYLAPCTRYQYPHFCGIIKK